MLSVYFSRILVWISKRLFVQVPTLSYTVNTNAIHIFYVFISNKWGFRSVQTCVSPCALSLLSLWGTWRSPNWISNIWRRFPSRGVIIVTGVAYKGRQEAVYLPCLSPWVLGVEKAHITALWRVMVATTRLSIAPRRYYSIHLFCLAICHVALLSPSSIVICMATHSLQLKLSEVRRHKI